MVGMPRISCFLRGAEPCIIMLTLLIIMLILLIIMLIMVTIKLMMSIIWMTVTVKMMLLQKTKGIYI